MGSCSSSTILGRSSTSNLNDKPIALTNENGTRLKISLQSTGSLRILLQNNVMRNKFIKFVKEKWDPNKTYLQTSFSTIENERHMTINSINFCVDIQDYISLKPSAFKRYRATFLFEKYVMHGALQQIPVSVNAADECAKALFYDDVEQVNEEILLNIEAEVLDYMVAEVYPPFELVSFSEYSTIRKTEFLDKAAALAKRRSTISLARRSNAFQTQNIAKISEIMKFILLDMEFFSCFKSYLITVQCARYLYAYVDAVEMKEKFISLIELQDSRVRHDIFLQYTNLYFNAYLASGADHRIQFTDITYNELINRFGGNPPNEMEALFPAENELFGLFIRHHLDPFLSSDQYSQFVLTHQRTEVQQMIDNLNVKAFDQTQPSSLINPKPVNKKTTKGLDHYTQLNIERDIWTEELKSFLKSGYDHLFARYLKTQHNLFYLHFFQQVSLYEESSYGHEIERIHESSLIFFRYISRNGEEAIEIPENLRKNIIKTLFRSHRMMYSEAATWCLQEICLEKWLTFKAEVYAYQRQEDNGLEVRHDDDGEGLMEKRKGMGKGVVREDERVNDVLCVTDRSESSDMEGKGEQEEDVCPDIVNEYHGYDDESDEEFRTNLTADVEIGKVQDNDIDHERQDHHRASLLARQKQSAMRQFKLQQRVFNIEEFVRFADKCYPVQTVDHRCTLSNMTPQMTGRCELQLENHKNITTMDKIKHFMARSDKIMSSRSSNKYSLVSKPMEGSAELSTTNSLDEYPTECSPHMLSYPHMDPYQYGMKRSTRHILPINPLFSFGFLQPIQIQSQFKMLLDRHKMNSDQILKEIIEHPLCCRIFKGYLEHEGLSQILLFLIEVQEFSRIPISDFQILRGKKIFTKYLHEEAVTPVPVSIEKRNEIQNKLQHSIINAHLFNEVYEEVLHYIVIYQLPCFQISKEMKKIMDILSHVLLQRRIIAIPRRSSTISFQNMTMSEAKLLKNILKNQRACKFLKDYCANHYCCENILFWLDVENYELLPGSDYKRRVACKLFKKYIADDATSQINIGYRVKNEIFQNLMTGDKNLFKKAQAIIFEIMDHDTMPKFIFSPEYLQMVEIITDGC